MAAGLQAVDVLHRGDLRIAGEAAQRHHVGRRLVLEHAAGLGDEAVDGVGGVLRGGVGALGRQRRVAGLLRVGVVDRVAEVVAAEDDDEAMLAHRLDEDLDAGDA